jgi:hypothetical protein
MVTGESDERIDHDHVALHPLPAAEQYSRKYSGARVSVRRVPGPTLCKCRTQLIHCLAWLVNKGDHQQRDATGDKSNAEPSKWSQKIDKYLRCPGL